MIGLQHAASFRAVNPDVEQQLDEADNNDGEIYRIDLTELASVLGCVSADELKSVLSDEAKQSVAVYAEEGDQIAFTSNPTQPISGQLPPVQLAVVDAVHPLSGGGDASPGPLLGDAAPLGGEEAGGGGGGGGGGGLSPLRLLLLNLRLAGVRTALVLTADSSLAGHIDGTKFGEHLDVQFIQVSEAYKRMPKGSALIEASAALEAALAAAEEEAAEEEEEGAGASAASGVPREFLYFSSAVLAEPALIRALLLRPLGAPPSGGEEFLGARALALADRAGHKIATQQPVYLDIAGDQVTGVTAGAAAAAAKNPRGTQTVATGYYKLEMGVLALAQLRREEEGGRGGGGGGGFLGLLGELAAKGRVAHVDVEGRRWSPVRTRAQVERVRSMLERQSSFRGLPNDPLVPVEVVEATLPTTGLVLGIPKDDTTEIEVQAPTAAEEETKQVRFTLIDAPVVTIHQEQSADDGGGGDGHPPFPGAGAGGGGSLAEQRPPSARSLSRSRSSQEGAGGARAAAVRPLGAGSALVALPPSLLEDLGETEALLIPVPGGAAGRGASSLETVSETEALNFVLAAPEPAAAAPGEFDAGGEEGGGGGGRGLVSCRCGPPASVPVYLPSDIQRIRLETEVVFDENNEIKEAELQVVVTKKTPVIGWLLLPLVMTAGAATGPAADILEDQGYSLLLLNTWRKILSSFLLLPLAVRALMVPEVRKKMMRREVLSSFMVTVLGMVLCNLFYYLSMTRISAALTGLFENTVPILLIGVKLVQRQPVAKLEGLGVLVAILGAVMVGYQALAKSTGGSSEDFVIGTLYAFVAAIGLALYLTYGKICRPEVDVFVLNLCICVSSVFASILVMNLYFPEEYGPYESLPVKSKIGTIFGFLLDWSIFPTQLCISLMCDFLNITGILALMKYFDALFLSIANLTSPIITMIIDVAFSLTAIPSTLTISGCIVVIVGCSFVVKASAGEKTQVIEASKILQARKDGESVSGFIRSREGSILSNSTHSTRSVKGSIEIQMAPQKPGATFRSPLMTVFEKRNGAKKTAAEEEHRDGLLQQHNYGAV